METEDPDSLFYRIISAVKHPTDMLGPSKPFVILVD